MAASFLYYARKGLRVIETTGTHLVIGWLQQRRRREGPDRSTQKAPRPQPQASAEAAPIRIAEPTFPSKP